MSCREGADGAFLLDQGADMAEAVWDTPERTSERTVDVVVIGAGPAGEVCAGRLGAAGLEVVIVERELVGGECSYWACMPSKALLRPAQLLAEVARVPGAREAVSGVLDVEAVLRRRDEVIHDLDDSLQLPWLERRGVTLVRGRGRLAGERRVVVDGGEALNARRAVVVAVGSGAAMPPIPGLAESRPWTSREITTAKAVPERLLILGGGVVAVEMAQAWATLGSRVQIVHRGSSVLSREEPFAASQVLDGLREIGVAIRLEAAVRGVLRDAAGGVAVTLEGGETVRADELVVALGRHPHTDDIGLDELGLVPGATIDVDDQLRVPGLPWLYAIGDVNGRALLTHMGKYQGRIAADVILGQETAVADMGPPPRVIFTEPQVAAVGHTLASARATGIDATAADAPTSANAGASFHGRNAPGTVRIVIDRRRQVLVGATFTGPDVAELLHAATVAVAGSVPLAVLRHAVPAFPTRTEAWLALLEQLV